MTATAHALIGGAIASTIKDPNLGITLSFISHPLLDLIPHWDFGNNWRHKDKTKLLLESTLDFGFGILLSYFLFGISTNFWYFITCIIASEIWDLVEAPYWILNWKFPPFSWIYNVQSNMQGKAKLPWGIITQIVTVVLVVLILQNR
jgi:hypothetical protein